MKLIKNIQIVYFTEFYFISPPSVTRVVLSTAQAKFFEAVTIEVGSVLLRIPRTEGCCEKMEESWM